jgi:hypothetical protein
MNKIKLMFALFVSFLAIACSENTPTEPEPTVFEVQGESGFVGTVDGTNAFIALLIAKDEAIVYVCNGEEEISEWFSSSISDPTNISLTNSSGAKITGQFSERSFSGNVTLRNNNIQTFKASPNTGTETGVFRVHGELATQEEVDAGWILNSASEERGSFKSKSLFQATPKKPKIIDGTSNTLLFNGKSFSIERFFLIRSGSFSVVEMNG